jgi:hypothetical protein
MMVDAVPRLRRQPGPVVSLRVPGVDFPEAESVLGARPVEHVGGVAARGEFWRWRTRRQAVFTTEAYLWGLRSTATARALWMLLLPFTLINVAYWARPARPRGITSWAADSIVGMVCRLLALTLTATLTLGVAGVTMDLVAWQCLSSGTDCTASWREPFNLVGELPLTAYRRLAFAALAPLFVLAVLWLVSYRSWLRYERRAEITLAPDRLTEARFWRGRAWVERLRALHATVGMAVVDAMLVYPVAGTDIRAHSPVRTLGVVLFGLAVLAMLCAAAGALVPLPLASPEVHAVRDGPALTALRRSRRLAAGARAHAWLADRVDHIVASFRHRVRAASVPVARAVRIAAWGTVGLTGACLVYAVVPGHDAPLVAGAVPGFAGGVAILSVLQTLLLFALAAGILPLCWIARSAPRRPVWGGFVAPVIATVATMLAVAEAASLLYFAALSIGQLRTSGTGRAWLPAPPYPYEWAGLVFAVAMGAALVAAAVHGVRWQHLKRLGRRQTDRRDPALRRRHRDLADMLDRAHARGRLLESVPALVLIVFVPITALSCVGVGYSAVGQGPAALWPSQKTLTNIGAWSIGLISVVLVVAAARAGNTTPARRLVSAVYAMATFWPRAAHPFAAPSHGPRAVADIVLRVNALTAQNASVLLAGHSHGSVLVATAARYLSKDSLRRTALLTSACPLTRLIESFFSAFFDRAASLDLAHALSDREHTRWINLYRITDPIGGPVFPACADGRDRLDGVSAAIDELAPDPPELDLTGIEPEVRGHDSYLHDPAFTAAHDRLVGWLSAGPRESAASGSEQSA